jgi:drug/metabolite transporter (DMT)-like permease
MSAGRPWNHPAGRPWEETDPVTIDNQLGATVALGLTSALAWGTADFGGGLATRRGSLLGVVFLTQLTGAVLSAVAAVGRGEPFPAGWDLAWAVGAGVAGALGISALYAGLAGGRMGVVAPVTGVLAAILPVLVGAATEGLPPPLVAMGIGLGLVAVTLVTASPATDDRPSGAGLALVAGLGIGMFNVSVAQFQPGHLFAPFAAVRLVQVAITGTTLLVTRRSWRLARPVAAGVVAVGILDSLGNLAYIGATQVGRLDVAAVLSSLYPVATVILAILLLGERLSRLHALGIGLAGLAVALIAAG